MDETDSETRRSRWGQGLAQSRPVLLAVIVVLAVLVVLEPRLVLAALAGLIVIAAVAAFTQTERWQHRKIEKEQGGHADPVAQFPASLFVNALGDPVIVFDRERNIVLANQAAMTAFGSLEPGMPLSLKFRAPELVDLVNRAVRDGRALLAEYHERIPIERWYRVAATAIGGADGLFLLIFSDRGELRRVEKMRSDFIANASHELRTPLASISGFIETLRGAAKNDPAAREKFLGIMQDQTDRMARLIDDLLSLSRLEMKPYARPETPVDLGAIVSGVVRSLQHLAGELGIQVEENYPDEEIKVPGDRDELIQVFENLVSNALKYGRSGKRVVVSIERRKSEGENAVAVTVRDYGQGIPREHIPRITERFYRVDVDQSRVQKGTGLGLSIVKHILTRHGGRLVVESEVGKGAAFTAVLPQKGDWS